MPAPTAPVLQTAFASLVSATGGDVPIGEMAAMIALHDVMVLTPVAITTGLVNATLFSFHAPFALSIVEVVFSLKTVATVAAPTFDIKKNTVSIFSTLATIDVSETTSRTAAVPAVISVPAVAKGDIVDVICTVPGTGAQGCVAYVYYNRTA